MNAVFRALFVIVLYKPHRVKARHTLASNDHVEPRIRSSSVHFSTGDLCATRRHRATPAVGGGPGIGSRSAPNPAKQTLCGRGSLSSEAKKNVKMMGEVGKRIVSATVAARLQRPGELHVLAKAHVVVTQESVVEWTEEIHELRRISSFKSFTLRSGTAAKIQVFVASVQVLEEMLEIRNGVAQLILDPVHRLGLSTAKPSLDLPQLSSARAVYEGFKVVVQGLANMTDGAPWPWKAIPQTLLQFATMVELFNFGAALSQPAKRIHGLVDKIAQRIGFLLSVSRSGDGNNMELDSYIEAFLVDVQRIIIRLRMVENVHPIKTFPLTDYIESIIADEARKMQDAFQELQARFNVHTAYTAQTIAAGVAVIQGTTNQTLVLISQIHAAVTSSNTTQTYPTSIRPRGGPEDIAPNPPTRIPAGAKLPPKPIFFNGRDDLLDEIVALICALIASNIALMGPGGIGKTSLALAVLYDQRVIDAVGENRFFVSMEALIDIDVASARLAKHLDLAESADPLSAAIAHLSSLHHALLVIDNLETLWFANNASARNDTETFLSRLAQIPSLTLIVTSRGAIPPGGVQWSNRQSAELATLSLDAARNTFIQIATLPSEPTEKAALDTLLGEIDYVPLAVTLISRLALLKNSPSELLRRWQERRTQLLWELKMLSPIRHFILDNHPLVPDDRRQYAKGVTKKMKRKAWFFARKSFKASLWKDESNEKRHKALQLFASMRKIYFDIAASAPQEHADDFTLRSTQFAPEYGNLTSFLLHLINSEGPSEKLFDAVHAVSEYAYCTMPSPTLREALLLRLTTQTAWRAECLKDLGRTRLLRDEYSLAMDNLQAARILFAELGNRFQEAECRSILGDCLRLQELFDAAEAEVRAARDIFIELGYESDAAECTQQLGEICRQRDEYDQAIDHLTSARDTFKRHGERIYAAQCTQSIGMIQLDQGNLSAAGSDIQSALSEFEALGEQFGATQCTRMLGEVRRHQGDYDSAETLLTAALEASTKLGSRSDVAHCHRSFGRSYRDQDRTREALASFESARDIYEALGLQADVADCNSQIQNLRNLP
ncbi:hypothetical protein BKA62DRAFT_675243 [Auriculariales sp. MPI-PUGE-AT-0066]|nr:hypothetical protein BKA62DRAFT_675243 [Auriculariales sp. MPI-PUGE-AT-0066]